MNFRLQIIQNNLCTSGYTYIRKKNIKNLNLLENLGIIPLKSSGNTNNNVLGIAWWILRVCSCWCENQKSPRINVSPNQMGLT